MGLETILTDGSCCVLSTAVLEDSDVSVSDVKLLITG